MAVEQTYVAKGVSFSLKGAQQHQPFEIMRRCRIDHRQGSQRETLEVSIVWEPKKEEIRLSIIFSYSESTTSGGSAGATPRIGGPPVVKASSVLLGKHPSSLLAGGTAIWRY
jgi:hypothetical protein